MNIELKQQIEETYIQKFDSNYILVNSPGRINIIGEHTDYNDGFVLPAAIDKSIIAAIGESDTEYSNVVALDNNETYTFTLQNIKPIPHGNWKNYIIGVVAELQKNGCIIKPFNVVFAGDIPKGAGLSSSAALENSIVFGLNTLFNLSLTKLEMIQIAQHAEHHYVGVRCGIMDQYASMFGIENHAILLDCRSLQSKFLKINFNEFQLVLINTNVSHNLVDAEYNDRREVCEKVASLLQINALRDATKSDLNKVKSLISEDQYQKALYIIEENERVLKAAKYIEQNNIQGIGKLLYDAHDGAQYQFKISCKELDFLVEQTKHNSNVIGSRMMGGGFGGCTINIVKTEAVKEFTEQVTINYRNKFGFDCSIYFVKLSNGTHIINKTSTI